MILGPTIKTREFPVWPLAGLACCTCLNSWTYDVLFSQMFKQEAEFINPWRIQQLGLPAMTGPITEVIEQQRPPVVIACSPLLCGPKQTRPADYPDNAHVTGFVFVPKTLDAQGIAPAVIEFLSRAAADAAPVIYLGFGSMPAPDPMFLARLAIDSCRAAGVRAIVMAGSSGLLANPACTTALQAASDLLLVVPAIPHDWLFPKMRCIVHHAGVGTTAAALLAGVPQVPCPFMLDQPHNSKLLQALGVAPTIVPYSHQTTAAQLTAAVQKVLANDGDCVGLAASFGAQVREESAQSLATIVRLVEAATPLV